MLKSKKMWEKLHRGNGKSGAWKVSENLWSSPASSGNYMLITEASQTYSIETSLLHRNPTKGATEIRRFINFNLNGNSLPFQAENIIFRCMKCIENFFISSGASIGIFKNITIWISGCDIKRRARYGLFIRVWNVSVRWRRGELRGAANWWFNKCSKPFRSSQFKIYERKFIEKSTRHDLPFYHRSSKFLWSLQMNPLTFTTTTMFVIKFKIAHNKLAVI